MENSPQTLKSPVNGESGFPAADDETKSERTAETKKRRKLTGMPDPDAEVIALSPKTLLATNRFVCEICNKGFQRDQNLQLHRRGHNLPWTLRSRTNKEARKRVYVCPEPTCVHHNPSRALGDLTGIKKHFCRKHGEKKYECSRCFKKYAVPSDWKAHVKTCGSREYRCDCGTLFSRKDSFITHRAFCDALAQETARSQSMAITSSGGDTKVQGDGLPPPPPPSSASSPPPPPLTPSTCVLSPVLSVQSSAELPENQTAHLRPPPQQRRAALSTSTTANAAATHEATATTTSSAAASNTSTCSGCVPGSSGVFASVFGASTPAELPQSSYQPAPFSGLLQAMAGPDRPAIDPISLSLASSLHRVSTLLPTASEYPQQQYASGPQPALSATALLQKAAQMGATSSNSSFLCSLGLAVPSPSDPQDNASTMASDQSHWNHNGEKLENNSLASGLGLGPPSGGSSGYNELMMDPSGLFGNKPTTLDFLGLGMGGGEASSGGISAFLTSMGVRASFAGVSSARDAWDDPSDRKPSML